MAYNGGVVSAKPILQNMIRQQIRTWEVLDESVLRLYEKPALLRERFVADSNKKPLAYADLQLPISESENADGAGRARMLEPKLEARFLQALALQPQESVLHIGTGSGFFAALLAHVAKRVVSVEWDASLAKAARTRLHATGIGNVEVIIANGLDGYATAAPYDAIVLTGAVGEVPAVLFEQLASGGRLLAAVGTPPVMPCRLFTKRGSTILHNDILETCIPLLHDPARVDVFKF